MLSALEHAHYRKRGDRAADVRDHEQLCGSSPCALQPDVVEIDPDELGDLRRVVVDVGKQLEHELGSLQLLLYLGQAIREIDCAIGHSGEGDLHAAVSQGARQHISHGFQLGLAMPFGEAEDLPAGERRRFAVEECLEDVDDRLALEGASH